MKITSLVLAALMGLAAHDAEAARRLGGGKSIGQQSPHVTQRDASRSPANPAAPAAAPQNASATPQGAAAPAAARPGWKGALGGLAAGLGLAWLAHSLGLGEAFGTVLLFVLAGVIILALLARRRAAAAGSANTGGYAFQGAAAEAPLSPRQYSPDKVGNDASARPWERISMGFDAAKYAAAQAPGGVRIGSALAGPAGWSVPEGFDTAGFVAAAKRNFVSLQDAWDRSDVGSLRAMMTDGMLAEIKAQLAERESGAPGQPNKTDVVMLEGQLLGIEDLGEAYLASVEFSGMIREEPSAGPSPFREVWNMTKPKTGNSGWLVAGVQALQ